KIVKTPKEGTLPSIKKIDNDETNTVLLPTNSNREEGVSKQDSNKLPSTGDANSLTIFLQLGGLVIIVGLLIIVLKKSKKVKK
ncbi:LPXTG cell wall anchor domain-containing protein, partial [Listeria monocytogenes]|nr:LPXTG cell wall anchor domain-containing protein [Listeria monocytogenes]